MPPFQRSLISTLALACAAFAATAQAQDKPVELRFANWLPAQHSLAKTGFEPWAKSVEAASKGSIKVMLFPAQQLGKAPDHYDMARDGIADMTWVSPGYQAARFPVFAASELPFLISQPGPGSAAVDAWYRSHADKEMKDVKLCFAHVHIGTLHSKTRDHRAGAVQGHEDPPVQRHRGADDDAARRAATCRCRRPSRATRSRRAWPTPSRSRGRSLISFNIDKAVKFHLDVRLYAASFVWVDEPRLVRQARQPARRR